MIWRSGSIRWLPPSRTVLACAGIFLSVSAVCQSDPAALMPGCLPTNEQALPVELTQTRTFGSKREQVNPWNWRGGHSASGHIGHFIPGASARRSSRTFFSQSIGLFSDTLQFVSLPPTPMRMRYFVDVNPALFQEQAPSDGFCAILAHELVHVVSLSRGNRIRRLGLVRLLSKGQIRKFERRTDLEAIHRGYADGLKSYREWVYGHIPPSKLQEKQRNYFSPEEIDAIEKKLLEQPDLFAYWSEHVPMNLRAIENGKN